MAPRRRTTRRARPHTRRLRVESLEDRRMLAVATVTTALDVVDFADGVTSLREAIFAANTLAGADTIDFEASLDGATIEMDLALGEFAITDSLTIDASGLASGLTIDAGNGADGVFATLDGIRIFNIDDGVSGATIEVGVVGLTLIGGDKSGSGGAVSTRENTVLSRSVVTGNYAGGGGGIAFYGNGSLLIDRCTISANSAALSGGGLRISGSQSFTLSNSTVANNVSRLGSGGGVFLLSSFAAVFNSTISGNECAGSGGGIAIYHLSMLSLAHSTIANNVADRAVNEELPYRGGGIAHGGGGLSSVTSTHSIISQNRVGAGIPDDVWGPITAEWSLIEKTAAASVTGHHNLLGQAALLDSLGDNGGLTFTHALLPGSPAIDMGDLSFVGPPDFDQRGEPFARVHGGRIDIGAYEAQPLQADFDGDHDVDGLDFLALQIGYGTAAPNATKADGDADGDLDVDADDVAIWEAQYGLSEPTELPSLVVTTEQDVVDAYDGLTSLREAIVYANGLPGADTITFDPALTGTSILLEIDELTITDDVTIDGLGAELLSIDGQQTFRVFNIDDLDDGNEIAVTLEGLTITGGLSTSTIIEGFSTGKGGGIRSRENLTVQNSTISQNESGEASHGGGIWADGTTTIASSLITGNRAGDGGNTFDDNSYAGAGGGIFVEGIATITNSVISNNSSGAGGTFPSFPDFGAPGGAGGGIRVLGTLNILDSTVTGNQTGPGGRAFYFPGGSGAGGGISVSGTLIMGGTTVTGNTTADGGGRGGGIWVTGSAFISDSTLSNNSTGKGASPSGDGGSGGGILLSGSGTKEITNSTISGNTTGRGGGASEELEYAGSGGHGGGIYLTGPGLLTISHSTITGNSTGVNGVNPFGYDGQIGYGAGISHFSPGTVVLTNTIVAGNKRGHTLPSPIDSDLASPGMFSASYSLIGVDTGATIIDNGGNQIGTTGSLVDPLLGPLQDNGGPTFTHALLPDSPAIDMGDPGFVGPPDFDQRGSGFGRVSNGQIDIGAFEVQVFPFPLSQRAVPTSSTAPALSPQLVDLAITANQTKAEGGGRKAEYPEEEYLPASLASAISELDEAPRLAARDYGDIAVSRPTDEVSGSVDASLDEELVFSSL